MLKRKYVTKIISPTPKETAHNLLITRSGLGITTVSSYTICNNIDTIRTMIGIKLIPI